MEIKKFLNEMLIFKDLSEESLMSLSEKAELRDFEQGEIIIRFGEEGKLFGIVVSGEFEAARTMYDGSKEVFQIFREQDCFGEMSLMTREPTTADVIARRLSRAILIPHNALYPIIARESTLATLLAKTISKRLVEREVNRDEQIRLAEARTVQEDPYGLYKFSLPEGGKILTINGGSSSLKYRVFDTENQNKGSQGLIERIGLSNTRHIYEKNGNKVEELVNIKGFPSAFDIMINTLGGTNALKSIRAVGHRVVHGGEEYDNTIIIDKKVLNGISGCKNLAPLHIPANISGIEEAMKKLPNIPHVAVFDTGFHKTIPKHAQIYGVPYNFYMKGIRRYGFHGMSHMFVSLKAATFLKKPYNELKLITCHLGNGASIAAIDHGRCIDTSMGMTPLEGLIMGTRSGDIDPGALLYLMKEENISPEKMEQILMKESGLLGLSGVSSDMREVLKAASSENDQALLALQTFCYRIKKYIGAFWASLGGLDALVFTGGIGENSAEIRARACQGLSSIGLIINEDINRSERLKDTDVEKISIEGAPVQILVIPTDEERMIARETARAISGDVVSRVMRISEKAIPIGVSAHHVHMSKDHVESLFGKGYNLTVKAPLSQPGQFTCTEQVNLIGPKGKVERVRILGPEREETQVEISRTEEFKLGIDASVRMSGDIEGTPGLTIEGPKGSVTLEKGVICAKRHIHMTPIDALSFGIRDRDVVMVNVEGSRSLIFGDVTVRVNPNFKLEFHLDTDEANAAEVNTGMHARLHSIQPRQ